jgi:hypothetical protein
MPNGQCVPPVWAAGRRHPQQPETPAPTKTELPGQTGSRLCVLPLSIFSRPERQPAAESTDGFGGEPRVVLGVDPSGEPPCRGGTRLRGPGDPRRLSPPQLGAAGSAGDWQGVRAVTLLRRALRVCLTPVSHCRSADLHGLQASLELSLGSRRLRRIACSRCFNSGSGRLYVAAGNTGVTL